VLEHGDEQIILRFEVIQHTAFGDAALIGHITQRKTVESILADEQRRLVNDLQQSFLRGNALIPIPGVFARHDFFFLTVGIQYPLRTIVKLSSQHALAIIIQSRSIRAVRAQRMLTTSMAS
jgi:hypothetical protein